MDSSEARNTLALKIKIKTINRKSSYTSTSCSSPSSLQQSPVSLKRNSIDEATSTSKVAEEVIKASPSPSPSPPSPTHIRAASSSQASSSSPHSGLRVVTPDTDTSTAAATSAAGGFSPTLGFGGVMSGGVSGASQLLAALDMKTKTSNAKVAAAVTAAAVAAAGAMDLVHAGTPTAAHMQSQKIKKLVRRNASDKLRLIQMVHDNPILWDSRLPNFKGAEEEKNRAWEMIGKEFNAPGRRVARAFKSLRESYRRELAHVKLMGNGFKPKWSLYDAMDFLRDVIRERKGGSHAAEQAAIGLNLSAFSQHLNNNNNHNKTALKLSALHHSSFNESALNLSKCSPGLNISHEDYYYYVKPELDLSAHAGSNGIGGNAGGGGGVTPSVMPPHPMPAHQTQQQNLHQQQQKLHSVSSAHDSRVSSTRNDSNTQNSNTFDDLDASSVHSGDETSMRNANMSNQGSDEVEELEAIDADFPYPLILDANSPRSMSATGGHAMKRKRRDLNGGGGETMDGSGTADDDDDYEGQMMQQHRHLRQQNGGVGSAAGNGNGNGGGGGGGGSGGSGSGLGLGGMNGCMLDMPPPQTVREVLNSKFCGFISAKLNSMEDTEADNLMNKILMLLVQTQTPMQTSDGK